ncbi:MAG: type II and III secretion system protein family protein [Deltaproteobacteria bacterium]|nr:type II and III secretion system protein family protein [Deltaproteobacteria bacterium]
MPPRTIILLAVSILLGSSVAAAQEIQKVRVDAASAQYLSLGKSIKRVSVGSSEIADVAAYPPDQLLITGKSPGQTTATVWLSGDNVVVVRVNVTPPLAAMQKAVEAAVPSGKVKIKAIGASILMTGKVPSAEDVARAEKVVAGVAGGVGAGNLNIVNMLTVPGDQQVQLEVSFAEVSRSNLREIGVNFWSKKPYSSGGIAGGLLAPTNGIDTASPQLTNQGDIAQLGNSGDNAVPLLRAPLSGTFGAIFSSTLGGFPFSATLSLLASKGYARTLAEPTLVAMSGKSASFLAGGEFPVPLPQALGQIGVEYRKFGIQLEFTPTVMGDDIQLDLKVTSSDVDPTLGIRLANTTVPGLTERFSQTTVRLKDGQSFVIAGLLSDKVRSTVDKVPFLGELPILGTLFRSSSYQRDETELLVVVTAKRVRPLSKKPALPGENHRVDPSDLELFFLGTNEPLEGGGRTEPVGAVGFKR